MQRLGLPAEADTAVDPHQAAIALAVAMNQARQDMADRADLRTEALHYGTAKLDALRKRLEPLYAAIPSDVELFDLGLVTPKRPRLYVDILSYIEMNRDQTAFRFMQETRTGRITLAETTDEKAIVDEVTRYVARRLVERERALATATPLPPTQLRPGPVEGPRSGQAATSSILRQAQDEDAQQDHPSKAVSPAHSITAGLPKVAPSLPMTAEEAFRQWTRPAPALDAVPASPSVSATEMPAPMVRAVESAVAEPANAIKDELVTAAHTALKQPEAIAASVLPVGAAATTAGVVVASALATGAAAMAAPTNPAVSTPSVRTIPAQLSTTHRSSGGGWLWALLALLIGIGLGALALYLYAANMMR